MSSGKLISLIVPIYNVSSYMDRCVRSLQAQTYPNVEIILVDDGSTDESAGMCDAFGEQDTRIRVIHKENGGLSSARNAGIEVARGAYLAFIDGDDFVAENYVQVLLDACEKNGTPMAACGYVEYYSEEKQISHCGEGSCVISGEEAIKDIFTQKNHIHVVAWNKLYARELFAEQGIRYPHGKLHEDVFTTYRLCAAAERVAYVNVPCYYYVQRQGSIMSRRFNPKRLQLLEAVETIRPFVEEQAPRYDAEFAFYTFLNYLTVINAMADSGYRDSKLFAELREKIRMMLPSLRENPYFGTKHKLTALFLGCGMGAFFLIRKVYKIIG